MGFVKSYEEMTKVYRETAEFYDAEMLMVLWETKPEIVERLLPAPLKPPGRPLALAFVANYPRTNFGMTYLEGALFLRAEFNGEVGNYCLAMFVTDDMAMAGGREVYGYPKKIAGIEIKRDAQNANGRVEKHGVRIFQVQAGLTGKFNVEGTQDAFSKILNLNGNSVAVTYNFKHFPAPEGGAFDYPPRLIREEVEFRPHSIQIGQAEILMQASEYDPWSEVEIVKVLGGIYFKGNNSMRKGKAVAEVDPASFAPYAFLKWDK